MQIPAINTITPRDEELQESLGAEEKCAAYYQPDSQNADDKIITSLLTGIHSMRIYAETD